MANKMVLNENENDEYFNSMPPGFRFVPTDEVLILCYLRKKLLNEAMPINRIPHLNIYQYHPRDLTARYDDRRHRENEWYFFTPITRKYVNSTSRPNRVAQNGFWKADARIFPIKDRNNEVVGYRARLQFYEGKYPKVNKTEWIMHEYKINPAIVPPNMMLDDCVLCKIFKSKRIQNYQNRMPYQLEHPVDRNAAGSTSIVGPSNTTLTTGDDELPVQHAMEHEAYSNLEVQQDGSSDSRKEEEDGDWLIVGVEHLSISSDPMIG